MLLLKDISVPKSPKLNYILKKNYYQLNFVVLLYFDIINAFMIGYLFWGFYD